MLVVDLFKLTIFIKGIDVDIYIVKIMVFFKSIFHLHNKQPIIIYISN